MGKMQALIRTERAGKQRFFSGAGSASRSNQKTAKWSSIRTIPCRSGDKDSDDNYAGA